MGLNGFDPKWRSLPDYIIGITKEIWEDRGVDALNHYYAPDIPVRTPLGVTIGNQPVIAATNATLAEFPDRELLADDVIWSEHETGYLSSHRIFTTATHAFDGAYGPATGKRFGVYVIADCAVKDNVIFDEWLVRDYGGIVRQLGMDPRGYAAQLIEREGGPDSCARPFTPASDVEGSYRGNGNGNVWGELYADTMTRMLNGETGIVCERYDRAVASVYAGGQSGRSYHFVEQFWQNLRASFPNASFKIHHQIGMNADILPPRSAIRWSLDGRHEGRGSFGEPTGAHVHVMGLAHAEFGPFTLPGSRQPATIRREYVLFDEIAIWKQILLHTGELR